MTASIIEHFSTLKDPRIERHKQHDLIDIIVLTLSAVASGADGWEAIEDFGKEKIDWLRQYISLENGVPSHDCIFYVLSSLSPTGFRECFMSWTDSVVVATGGEVIAIDGKTARGSRDRKNDRNPLHMVSAWACSNRMVLGQQATDEKSNEITAIPKLLNLLEIKGCIITIDAMGCQRAIAKQIIKQEGDYVLGLKGNQSKLHEAVEDFFETARTSNFKDINYDYKEEIDKGHGRLETRRYWVSNVLLSLPNNQQWEGLKSIGMVERECIKGEVQSLECRYFINSLPAEAKPFATAVRGHWGVENPLHWRLDVILGDDASRIKGNAATIMTSIRHLCYESVPAGAFFSQLGQEKEKSGLER